MEQEMFWNRLREIVREEIKRQLTVIAPIPEDKAYTIREFCARFQISKPTLYQWVKMGKISPVKMGRRVYFRKKDVDGLIG